MRDFLKSLNNSLQTARQRFAEITAPARSAWAQFTAPIWTRLAPVTDAWRRFTAPLRNAWASFRERFPLVGSLLGWTGRLVKWGIYLLLFLILGVGIGLFGRLPSTEELKNIETANSTEIYTADSVLIGKFYIENRTAIALENISPYIINALIATEDKRFLEHSGIDIQSWFRVGYGVLAGEGLGGGSTLSQQLAKNLYPRQKYKIPGISLIINKIRENFISVSLEKIYTKPELLNLYLNTVPFGGDVFGINVASRQYFNKKPKDLSVDQAATLVGMLKGTTLYNPVRNPKNAQKRRNVVLRQMVNNGHLSQAEYDQLSPKPVGAKRYNVDSNNGGLGTYFREYLRTDVMPKLLEKYKKDDDTKYNLYTDGLKIYTTLHSKMQRYAEEAVAKQMQELQKQFDKHWKSYKKDKPWGDDKWIDQQLKNSARWDALMDAGMSKEDALKNFEEPVKMSVFSWNKGGSEVDTTMSPIDSVRYYFCLLNCGFMAMDHRNGYIRAWVGGTNFKYFKFDHILSKRQVGSTFKPIVYAAALQDTMRPCTYFANQIKMIVDWEPHNADERYGGWYSMSGALTRSVNVVAAQIIEKVGIQKTIDLATKMGVTSKLPREYGISLGAADINLYDMVKVYGTIANQGVRPEPVAVVKVVNRSGEVVYDYKAEMEANPELGPHVEALTVNQAATMTKMLQNVIDYGTGSRLRRGYGIQGDFAGKTGTTQNQADGWFVCFNPQLVTGAWVGAESPAVRFRSMSLGQGSAMALPIVGWFWNKVANDKKLGRLLSERFPTPKPEVLASLGCHPWVSIKPDSFNLLLDNMRDSTLRDSMIAMYTTPAKDGNDMTADLPGGEVGAEPLEKAPENEEEKKPGLFKKLFGHKPEEEKDKEKPKDEKDKKKPAGGDKKDEKKQR
ncbi:MAG: transglycosylase domain-containing protein [Lewinellaceae bacterium]|jgi:penicillin-binding protein 1A|nr:transglycosylase domain-containing protein [Lewinellaceae bacterium]